jgi:Cu/Ag efflux protein CusF
LIDSESNAKAGFERFESAEGSGGGEDKAKKPSLHHGRGQINRIDPGAGKINISHDPIPTLSWPAMTMDFPVADKKALTAAKPGDTIEFELAPMPSGEYIITRIIPGKRPERK